MECLLCGRPFEGDDDAAMFDEMLAHLEEEHPEAVDAMDGWASYEQWAEESDGAGGED